MKDYAKQDFIKEIVEEEYVQRRGGPSRNFLSKEMQEERRKEKLRSEMEHTLLTTIREYRAEFGVEALKTFLDTQTNLPF